MRKLVIIILAAGQASRMGQPKQLLEWKGKTIIERMVEKTLAISEARTMVVTGAYHDFIVEKISKYKIEVCYNAQWNQGMGTSISVGVKAARKHNPKAILVTLADQVAITDLHLLGLIRAFTAKGEQVCVCSQYHGIKGVPAVFPPNWFEELENLNGDQGARKILNQEDHITFGIFMEEAGIDIDTPLDWKDFIG